MNIRACSKGMDEMLVALFLFWIPVAMVPLGLWYSMSSPLKNASSRGRLFAFTGVVLICISPWTVPSSPSTAAGHLLGAIIGPCMLILLGIYLISFSGNVPVGKLPRSDRKLGVLMTGFGFIWLAGMHWWILTPQLSPNEVNHYWFVFWPTFIILTSCLASCSAVTLLMIGEQRKAESNAMFIVSGLSFSILILGLNVDGPLITADEFREHLWLAVADLAGITVGSLLSIFVFALVIYSYERSLPAPKSISPPTESELKQVSTLIASHLGGEDE
ncbi:MAG: hypothetical protein HN923_04595 [Euryarchaeota archaeon]|nr:hypothetical protein [Euryarchaeota archaeon]MBT7637482.1 hypothetical protein [Euryarchaeota archaeon]